MFKNACIIGAAILLSTASVATFARAGGGGGGGSGHFGSTSSQHISSEGLKNTNGINAVDRDKGLQRSADRESQKGLTHKTAHKGKTHTHGKAHQ
ncbi:hypothetical protein SAMN04515620_15614 [Collimonas sp. OK607]|uniref:hypothetical protein n=1 Tax=Collimonas sp. OK607 TaxID=1798194 RepID=UPI0008E2DBBD|nr:hypothetical protein [Collimonas sp. OK607]SFB37661.1 hypothetical protein SAMN04515620_15614 [Collimonas sp. OK607]